MQHAGAAVDEVRRAEFFRRRWSGAGSGEGQTLAAAVPLGKSGTRKRSGSLQRAVCAKPPCDEGLSAEREPGPAVESTPYEGSMLRYLKSWIDQLRWQRLKPMEKLADMLLNHLEGILNFSTVGHQSTARAWWRGS